jgi:anti-anti-sigma factor
VSLSIEVRSGNGAVVVALAGTAEASTLELLRDPLSVALADARVLVLDLDEVTTLDAAALRNVLIGVLLDTACGSHLRIAVSNKATVASLAAARIHELVSVQPSLAEALAEDQDEVVP